MQDSSNKSGREISHDEGGLTFSSLGSESVFASEFMAAKPRLCAMIEARLNPLLAGRMDASDVLQETYCEAHRRKSEYQKNQQLPFFLWLRRLAKQTLNRIHRDHLDRQKRNPGLEYRFETDGNQSCNYRNGLANELSASISSPASRAARNEKISRLYQAIGLLSESDQQILGLRHLEQLTHEEIACELAVTVDAIKQRYRRAIRKLASSLRPDQSEAE